MKDEKKHGDAISPNEGTSTHDVLSSSVFEAQVVGISESSQHSEDLDTPAECDLPEDMPCSDAGYSRAPQTDIPPVDVDYMKQIDGKLESIAGTEQCLFSEIREIHKLYHTEFAGRLKSMQDELEQYHKIDKGRAYDDILAAIARIYGNNETLADEVEEPKAKRSIRYMLLDIEDLLGSYGMAKLRSNLGEKRNSRHCQVLNHIPTDDPTKHDTVAKSYNSGFYIDNRTVMKEIIDIYIYEGHAVNAETEENQIIEAGKNPVTE